MKLFGLSIPQAMIGPWQLALFVLPVALVGLATLGFVKYSKTKRTGWAVLGSMSAALLLLLVVAFSIWMNEKPWRQ